MALRERPNRQNTWFISGDGALRSQYEYNSVRLSSAFCGMSANGTIQVLRWPGEHDGLVKGCCALPAGLPLPSGGTRSPPTILPFASRNTTAVRRSASVLRL
ncbi:MAG: hypothetical protein JWO52_2792 [Gammaproteobacteria bacterium]|nr:hypothetical protein [Gammaproteobacteria bacterium]